MTSKTTIIGLATLLLTTGLISNMQPAQAVEGDVLSTLFCAGPGVGVAFDGTTLYWIDFGLSTLNRCDTSGGVLPSIPITGLLPGGISTVSYDATRGLLWGASPDTDGLGTRHIYQITTAGVATFMFDVTADGAFYTDGLAYDGEDDSLWISGDVAPNIFHYDTAGTLIASFPIPNLPVHPAGFTCGNSGIAAGVGVLYLGFNGCNVIQKHDKATLAFQNRFDIGTGRTEDLECDNVTFPGVDAVWTKDAGDIELIAFEVPEGTCPVGGGGATEVEIDIKPGSDPSSVSCKNTDHSVPVAVFGSESFDASTIDLATLELNGVSVTEVHGTVHVTDVNTDGFPDAVLHLAASGVCEATADAPLKETVDAILTGSTTDGAEFQGTGDIRIVNR